MARDPYNTFQCLQKFLLKTNQEVKKIPIFIVFASNFQVLGNIKNLLKLIKASKMKNVFILTKQMTKYVCIYPTEGTRQKLKFSPVS